MSQQSTHYTGRTPVERKLSGGSTSSAGAGSRASGSGRSKGSKGSRRSRSSRHDGVDDSDQVENPQDDRRGSYETSRDIDTLGTTSLYEEGGAFYDSTIGDIGDDGEEQKRAYNDEEDTGVEDGHSGYDGQGVISVRGDYDDEQTHDDKTRDSDYFDRRSHQYHHYGDNSRSPNRRDRRDFSFRSRGDQSRGNGASQNERYRGGHACSDRLGQGRDSDRSEAHHAHPRRSDSQHSRRRAPRDPSEMGDDAIPITRRNTRIPGGPMYQPQLRPVDPVSAAAESTIASTASTLTFDTRTRSTSQTSLSSVDDNSRRAKPPPRQIDVPDPDGNRSRVVISNMPWGRKESSANSARESKWDDERHRSHSPGRRDGARREFDRSARTEGRDYSKRSGSRHSSRSRRRVRDRESFEEQVPMGRSREDDDRAQKRRGKSANGASRPERDGSRARRDDGRTRRGDDAKSRRAANARDAGGRRRSRSLGGRDYDRRARRDLRQRSDATVSSWRSIRYDVDDRGFCLHHPRVRLMRERADGDWRTVRKKCPECIREDCPSMLGFGRDEDSGDDESRMGEYPRRRVQQVRGADPPHDRSFQAVTSSGARHSSSAGGGSLLDDEESGRFGSDSSLGVAFADIGMTLQTPEELEEEESTNRFKRRLAARAYHFPGNSWCQDWMQYLSNTHTVIGMFFHHPLHPMGFQERLVILFGSIAIGLTISNFTYLWFIRNGISVEEEVFTLNSRHTHATGIPEVVITKLMLTLWTLGSFLHTVFDLGLWHMKACTLCRYQGRIDERLVQWGRVVGLFIVMVAIGVGGYAVLLRASIEYRGEGSIADEVEESIRTNEFYDIEFDDKRSFRFLLGYLVEFVLALFVYYPLAVTILFSGVLGCGGKIPILGGRPREMKREARYEQRKKDPKILKALNLDEGSEEDEVYTTGSRSEANSGSSHIH